MTDGPASEAISPAKPNRRRLAIALPNLLTYGRIITIPLIVGLLFWPGDPVMRWYALGLYAIAGVTDYLDGYLARVYAQQSSLGRNRSPTISGMVMIRP